MNEVIRNRAIEQDVPLVAEEIVLSNIECAMDKYMSAFNFKNLNDLL